tara:strand:+ start:2084 stop:2323 length:240 start_codon:yes stop_codon:yes gene_type:complete
MSIYKYQAYLAYQEINESMDDIMQTIDADSTDASQIQDLVDSQEEIFNKYDISSSEIDNIKNGIEDSIRVKLGMNFEEN